MSRLGYVRFCSLLFIVFAHSAQAARLIIGDAATTREGLHYLPADDDFHDLCVPSKRTDYLDSIKCIPLNAQASSYVGLGGYFRERYEFFEHLYFGSESKNPDQYFTNRTLFHLDFHMGDHLRVFLEPGTYTVQGNLGIPRPTDEDQFDMNQAFVDLRTELGDDVTLTLRPGRYEMVYGSGRLVDPREGPNIRQRWDGIKLIVNKSNALQIDAFLTRPTLNTPGIFDDHGDPGNSFWGVYGTTLQPSSLLSSHFDLYYFGYQSDFSAYEPESGAETRQTLGLRWWGKQSAVDYDLEGDAQWGHVGGADVVAWQAAFQAGYTFEAPTGPRLAARGDFTSGGGDSNTLHTFNPLFAALGPFSGEPNPFIPSNLLVIRPIYQQSLNSTVSLAAEWICYWRTSLNDGVYGPGLYLPSSGSSASSVGTQPDVEIIFQVDPHLSVFAYYSHVFVGQFISDALANAARDMNYVSVWASYKF
ncbi:MAG: alginate export family protein [Oligoflexia bacterium]|nr:alginate export family protein [Oligoflexia bacterium]